MSRLLAFLLIAEGLLGGVRTAELLPLLPAYDTVAIALILARGFLGAAQFVSGWLLANRRPQGFAMAPLVLLAGAALTCLDVGFNLAPTSVYYWLRWQVTGAYAVYALGAAAYLRRRSFN